MLLDSTPPMIQCLNMKKGRDIGKIRKEMNIPLAILLDLEGPKIRTGNFETDEVSLVEGGQIFILTSQEIIGNNERVSINYKELPKDVKKGDVILIDDGKIKLEVIKTDGKEITTNVIVGGELLPITEVLMYQV